MQVREDRLQNEAAAQAIQDALVAEHFATPLEIEALRQRLSTEIHRLDAQIAEIRQATRAVRTHETEILRSRGRALSFELAAVDEALSEIEQNVSKDKSHRNTLLSLAPRQKRAQSARAALGGVQFVQCPQCYQTLPPRDEAACRVCGQLHSDIPLSPIGEDSIEADTKARADELEERINLQTDEMKRLREKRLEIAAQKQVVDEDLDEASKNYDSSYLAASLAMERERARLVQRVLDLRHMEALANKVNQLQTDASQLAGREGEIRAELKTARATAERDTSNLDLLKQLFLDCLIRSRLHGFLRDDVVEINSPNFLPQVHGRNTGDIVQTSFANLGSGGKKTFFKCCFAVAIHRLAARVGSLLPNVLIIDSPMKNISERENPDQFAGFHEMLHELAETELKGTQFILIDKEIFRPKSSDTLNFQERHMKPDDKDNPPLIRGYRGK